MKKSFLSLLVCFAVVSLTSVKAFSQGKEANLKQVKKKLSQFKVIFIEPQSISSILKSSKHNQYRVKTLQSSFVVGGKVVFTDFYPIKNREYRVGTKKIVHEYHNSRKSFLQDILDNSKDDIVLSNHANKTGQYPKPNIQFLEELKKELAGYDENAEINIESIIVVGKQKTVQAMENSTLGVDSIIEIPSVYNVENINDSNIDKDNELSQEGIMSTASYTPPSTWLPRQGYVYTYPSSSGGRYVLNYMWWLDTSGFDENSTYEHDFFLNNYDNKTYLDRSEVGLGFPNATYLASNLPTPYLDTRFLDPDGEIAYTIGSARASDIMGNTDFWYYTYIRTADGNTSSDSAKLSGQLGHRYPSWCDTTWCSFGDQTEKIIPAWNISIPNGYYWQF